MFILNTGRYALAFTVTEKGKERKIEFDRRRVFLDTGNIATNGITEITDEQYAQLKEYKLFMKQFEDGSFTEVDNSELKSGDSEELKAKDEEIAKLKKELKESKKDSPSKKELEAKDKEISDLKKKLEALSKKDAETEGF